MDQSAIKEDTVRCGAWTLGDARVLAIWGGGGSFGKQLQHVVANRGFSLFQKLSISLTSGIKPLMQCTVIYIYMPTYINYTNVYMYLERAGRKKGERLAASYN